MKIKFNHKEEDSLEALGCKVDIDVINKKLNRVLGKFLLDNDTDKKSQLSEIIHDTFDYNIILFLATDCLLGRIKSKTIISSEEEEI